MCRDLDHDYHLQSVGTANAHTAALVPPLGQPTPTATWTSTFNNVATSIGSIGWGMGTPPGFRNYVVEDSSSSESIVTPPRVEEVAPLAGFNRPSPFKLTPSRGTFCWLLPQCNVIMIRRHC